MNTDLRVSLWNWVVEVIQLDNATDSVKIIWKDYLKRPLHQCSIYYQIDFGWLHAHFMKIEWHEAYNLIEFVLQNVVTTHKAVSVLPRLENRLNSILERELAGYRAINREAVPITDKEEVKAINQAMSLSLSSGLMGPHEHISKALSLLSKKPEP